MNNSNLLVILIIILIFVISNRLLRKEKIVDKFSSGNLASSNQEILINNTINDLVNRKFTNLRINEASRIDESNDEISTFQLDLDAPMGMISYFYGNPNPQNETYWVECNGQTIIRQVYPSFFEWIDQGSSRISTDYTLPNIVGRTIVGAGLISAPALSRNNSQIYGSDKPFHHTQTNVNFTSGQTGGYDVCPPNYVKSLSRAGPDESNPISVCENLSNMPPHIYLTAWMKVKNKKFKILF